MSGPRHAAFYRDSIFFATVTNTLTVDVTDPRILVDAVPVDNHKYLQQQRVAMPFGLARRPRKGQFVTAQYVDGSTRYAVITGHVFNKDTYPIYADPIPKWCFVNLDDLCLYHDETKQFIRMRSVAGSPTQAGPDGGAGIFDLEMQSGFNLNVTEYPTEPPEPPPTPPISPILQPPPPPTRAKLTMSMPGDALTVVVDQPAEGQVTISITQASGMTLTIDQTGNIVLDTPGDITMTTAGTALINAEHAEIGGPSGGELAYKSDVQNVVDIFNEHQHPTPSGISGTPTTTAPDPVGTVITTAE